MKSGRTCLVFIFGLVLGVGGFVAVYDTPVVGAQALSEQEKALLSSATLREASPGATSSAVPSVPTGKSDLFAPFE